MVRLRRLRWASLALGVVAAVGVGFDAGWTIAVAWVLGVVSGCGLGLGLAYEDMLRARERERRR